MTEEEARVWLRGRFGVPRETLLARYVELVVEHSRLQNLIAPSTVADIWTRHVVDSAQLVALDGSGEGQWIDIGSGAGFPGVVTAILTNRPTTLIEPRRKRAEFLTIVADTLGCRHLEVAQAKVEQVKGPRAATISARAVAAASALLSAAVHLSDADTLWLLPKGKSAQAEVDEARKAWHGAFHVEQSITQSDSAIIVATGVSVR